MYCRTVEASKSRWWAHPWLHCVIDNTVGVIKSPIGRDLSSMDTAHHHRSWILLLVLLVRHMVPTKSHNMGMFGKSCESHDTYCGLYITALEVQLWVRRSLNIWKREPPIQHQLFPHFTTSTACTPCSLSQLQVNLAITMDSVPYNIIVVTRVAIGRGFRLILTKPTIKSILNPSFGYPCAQLLL